MKILSDNGASRYIDGVALHWYMDGTYGPELLDHTHQLFPDKFILYTESCTGKGLQVLISLSLSHVHRHWKTQLLIIFDTKEMSKKLWMTVISEVYLFWRCGVICIFLFFFQVPGRNIWKDPGEEVVLLGSWLRAEAYAVNIIQVCPFLLTISRDILLLIFQVVSLGHISSFR